MHVIVVLIGFSLLVAIGFLAAFLWAVRSGQYDDDVSPGMRMLYEDKKKEDSSIQHNTSQTKPN
ncbi:MAG: cbb3-type cytochrome oxidase assembly protein CcoS [Bacteroidales bacterium]|nr:cbb3-type cytochrome oxidase assembly protein CcoS [Bacteroidales bacterium]MBK7172448.1 cbb3-type cytochrome oxidase assembly protein CcoS [Bacteroidales bacterium]